MGKVNIIINGVKAGEQSIPGEMHQQPNQETPLPKGSRVLVNGVPVEENTSEFPPLPQQVVAKLEPTRDTSLEVRDKLYDEDSFSLAENYSQWMNLKQNHSLDKMFLASTPDALMNLHTLYKYIGEVLNVEAAIPQVDRGDDDGGDEEDESVFTQSREEVKESKPVKKAPAKKAGGYSKYKKKS